MLTGARSGRDPVRRSSTGLARSATPVALLAAALTVGALSAAPAQASTRSCPRVAIQPNSGNLATKVRATNASCRTAKRVILKLRRDGVRRPLGYRCSTTQIGDGIMGELRYVCSSGRRQIRWSI